MITIHKYWLSVQDFVEVEMHKGAQILSCQTQFITPIGERPCLWCLVDTSAPIVFRKFAIFGTGHDASDVARHRLKFVGTVLLEKGKLVFHIFEYPSGPV